MIIIAEDQTDAQWSGSGEAVCAASAKTIPPGYTFRTVVVDTMNLVAHGEEPEKISRIRLLLTLLKKLGCTDVRFVVQWQWLKVALKGSSMDASFIKLMYSKGLFVVVPSWRVGRFPPQLLADFNLLQNSVITESLQKTIVKEEKRNWGVNDDAIALELGFKNKALLISTDKFRDFRKYLKDESLQLEVARYIDNYRTQFRITDGVPRLVLKHFTASRCEWPLYVQTTQNIQMRPPSE